MQDHGHHNVHECLARALGIRAPVRVDALQEATGAPSWVDGYAPTWPRPDVHSFSHGMD